MENIMRAKRMEHVHSDIRGPLYVEAMKMREQGIDVLRLNTGNPATFGFGLPKSIEHALNNHIDDGVGYCDFKGMPQAREEICAYESSKGIKGITPDDVFIGNGVSEVVSFALMPLLNDGDEVFVPSPSYSLWEIPYIWREESRYSMFATRRQTGIRTYRTFVPRLQIRRKQSLSSIRITQRECCIPKKCWKKSCRWQEKQESWCLQTRFMTDL